MTKKHFEAFAEQFRVDYNYSKHLDDAGNLTAHVEYAVAAFCKVARSINPRFDIDRFTRAVYGKDGLQ